MRCLMDGMNNDDEQTSSKKGFENISAPQYTAERC